MPGGSAHRPGYVLAVLGRFGSAQGWGPGPPLCAPVVEAFVVAGLPGRAASTKGTYRSVLRSLGGSGTPSAAPAFCASPARAPYSAQERAELFALAAAQCQAWRRRSALALLALGTGAGLRAGELAAATGDDVIAHQSGLAMRVGTGTGRVVPVAGPYAKAVAELAKEARHGYLFCPGGADRAYKNFVNNLGATTVPRLVNEGPNESRAITSAPVFLGNVESVEEHRALSIWMCPLVSVDPPRDTCIGFDDHEGRFRTAQEGFGVKVTRQAEAPAGRLGDHLVAELEASWWGRRHLQESCRNAHRGKRSCDAATTPRGASYRGGAADRR